MRVRPLNYACVLGSAWLASGCASMGTGPVWDNCKVGAVLGGFAGGVAGSQVAGDSTGETILGAAAGGLVLSAVGCAIERSIDADKTTLESAQPADDTFTDDEGVVRLASEPPAPSEPVDTPAVAAADGVRGTVQFGFNSTFLTDEARQIVSEIARKALAADESAMLVVGHASKEGDDYYNVDLSRRRAASVRDALISDGVPASRITVEGVGSSRPLSGADEYDPRNRRVEISAAE